MLDKQDLNGVLIFLLSDMSRYINGQNIIVDDGFSTNINRAKEICRLVIKENIDLLINCANGIRVDRIDYELLELMKKAGIYRVSLGIESGSQRILNNVDKGIKLEDYEKAKGRFIIDEFNIHLIRQDARVLHPLPHVEEIDLSLETENSDPRIAYFRQAENGLYARMAILEWAINGSKKNYENQS